MHIVLRPEKNMALLCYVPHFRSQLQSFLFLEESTF